MRENTEVDDLNNEIESGGDNAPNDNDDISSESQPLEPLDPRLEELIYAQNNDVGNSYRFMAAIEEEVDEHLKYCIETQTWFYFNGNIWEEDKGSAKSIRLFIGAFQDLYSLVAELDWRYFDLDQTGNSDEAMKVQDGIKRAIKNSLNKGKILAALEIASKQTQFRVNATDFDSDIYLVACKNGYINLKTFERLNPDPTKLITKQLDAEYNVDAKFDRWDQFMQEITLEEEELEGYLDKHIGYALTGDTKEHIAINITGNGSNGKSVFTNAIMNMMGDYSVKVPNDIITKQGRSGAGDESKASPQTAMLRGARLACTTELEEGMQIAESKFKDIVSGDPITARQLRQNPITFDNTAKLWFCGNHDPTVRGNDEGIWRRFKQVKFGANFKKPDLTLEEQFGSEEAKSHILNRALNGWKMVMKDREESGRIIEPKSITDLNKEYRANEDVLGQFCEDCCVVGESHYAAQRILRLAYDHWCRRNNYRGLTAVALNKALKQRGHVERKSHGIRLRKGIEVKPEALPFNPDRIMENHVILLEDRKLHGIVSNNVFFWWLRYLGDEKGYFESWGEEDQKAVSNIGTEEHAEMIRYYKSDDYIRGGKANVTY